MVREIDDAGTRRGFLKGKGRADRTACIERQKRGDELRQKLLPEEKRLLLLRITAKQAKGKSKGFGSDVKEGDMVLEEGGTPWPEPVLTFQPEADAPDTRIIAGLRPGIPGTKVVPVIENRHEVETIAEPVGTVSFRVVGSTVVRPAGDVVAESPLNARAGKDIDVEISQVRGPEEAFAVVKGGPVRDVITERRHAPFEAESKGIKEMADFDTRGPDAEGAIINNGGIVKVGCLTPGIVISEASVPGFPDTDIGQVEMGIKDRGLGNRAADAGGAFEIEIEVSARHNLWEPKGVVMGEPILSLVDGVVVWERPGNAASPGIATDDPKASLWGGGRERVTQREVSWDFCIGIDFQAIAVALPDDVI